MRVYTTLILIFRKIVDEAARRRIKLSLATPRLGAALVSIDPQTGYIKAMVGGQITQRVSTTLQPVVTVRWAPVLRCIRCSSLLYESRDYSLTQPYANYTNSGWLRTQVTTAGAITLASGTVYSSNTVYAQVAEAIGIDKNPSDLLRYGHSHPALASHGPVYHSWRSQGVTLLSASAQLLQPFAAGESSSMLQRITLNEDRNGNVIYEHKDNPVQAIIPRLLRRYRCSERRSYLWYWSLCLQPEDLQPTSCRCKTVLRIN